jgi:hypothetical protein
VASDGGDGERVVPLPKTTPLRAVCGRRKVTPDGGDGDEGWKLAASDEDD